MAVTSSRLPSTGGDTTAPTVESAVIPSAGTTLVLTMSEATSFGAGGSGGMNPNVVGNDVDATYASGTGTTTLTFNLTRTIISGETVTLDYNQPGGGFQDASGNELQTISGMAVTNNSTQTEPPVVQSATIDTNGTTLVLVFSKAVQDTFNFAGFALSGNSGEGQPGMPSGGGTDTITLTISATVYSGEVVTLAYSPGTVQDLDGNNLASFSGFSVTNNSSQTP